MCSLEKLNAQTDAGSGFVLYYSQTSLYYFKYFYRLKAVQTTEELKDVHSHFLMYYSEDVKNMLEAMRKKQAEAAKQKKKEKLVWVA